MGEIKGKAYFYKVSDCTMQWFIELCVGEIKAKAYFKFHKVHFSVNSAILPTKSAKALSTWPGC